MKLNRTVNEAMQRMTIEATSKENDYCKQSFKKCSFSNDLGGAEDDILWEEQHDKSDTDSNEEGDDMYDDMMTHEQIQKTFSENSDDN